MTRNQRRRVAKLRKARVETARANAAMLTARREIVRDNLSRPIKRETSRGLVSDYSPTRNPFGYTRPLRYTRGAANAGTSGGLPVA